MHLLQYFIIIWRTYLTWASECLLREYFILDIENISNLVHFRLHKSKVEKSLIDDI